jgi:transposase
VEEAVIKEIKSRKHHSRQYRQRAVELLLTGKTVAELAVDLGLTQSTLDNWKRRYLLDRSERPVDVEGMNEVELEQKYKQLLKEHEKLKRQQEILKKALGILSETLPTNMP